MTEQPPSRPPPAPRAPGASPAAKSLAPTGPDLIARVQVLVTAMDKMDYFQLFGLAVTANPAEIKSAYHREARKYHPDRFATLPDVELREKTNKLYKRLTEAYFVLRNDQKRAKYVADISGADREKKLRYTEESQAEQKAEAKKATDEQIGTTAKGRDCYKNGMKDFEARRYEAAIRQLKTALMYEPTNARYKKTLEEIETAWDKSRPKNDFRIK